MSLFHSVRLPDGTIANVADTGARGSIQDINARDLVESELAEDFNEAASPDGLVALDTINARIDELSEKLVRSEIVSSIDFSNAVSGQYVDKNGTLSSNAEFSILRISVNSGHKISLMARGYLTNVAMIAVDNHTTSNNTPLVVSTDSTFKKYEYVATKDMDLIISYYTNDSNVCGELIYLTETADNAIIGKIDEVVSNTGDLTSYNVSSNLFDKTKATTGKVIERGGSLTTLSGGFVTGLIPIEQGKKYWFNNESSYLGSSYAKNVVCYNANEAYVDGDMTWSVSLSEDSKWCGVTFGTGTQYAYFRVNGKLSSISTTMVVKSDEPPTEYEPYFEPYTAIKEELLPREFSLNVENFETSSNSYFAYALGNTKINCIGDSLTAGANYIIDNTGKSINESYPYYLGRMLNCDVGNYGKSGYTTKQWWDESSTVDYTLCDTVIIWLGTNGGLTDTIDTDCAGNDYTQFADTNTGCYGKIIEKIKSVNPDCFILLITPSESSGYVTTVSVIEKFGVKYNLPVLNMQGLGKDERPELHGNISNIHFGKAGNIFIANKIIKFLGNYFAKNPRLADFGETK